MVLLTDYSPTKGGKATTLGDCLQANLDIEVQMSYPPMLGHDVDEQPGPSQETWNGEKIIPATISLWRVQGLWKADAAQAGWISLKASTGN